MIEAHLATLPFAHVRPAWERWRSQIELHPFRNGVRSMLHFSHDAQLQAWLELASLENEPHVDDYLRSLAPPDMAYIPPGAFLMGSPDDDPDAFDNEKPQHEVWLRGYYMNRYPITNQQYRAFMEAGGYQHADYWREAEAARLWKDGRYSFFFEGPINGRSSYWDKEGHNHPQQPRVLISWHEALAYCRWAGMDLPTEAQWEKAAGWDATIKRMRRYPWGDEYDKSKVLPQYWDYPQVGQFCRSDFNFYGLADMTGLAHWCRSKYQPYPYQPDDGRELLEGENIRVLRGSSYFNFQRMRCRLRKNYYPDCWGSYRVGFRPVFPPY